MGNVNGLPLNALRLGHISDKKKTGLGGDLAQKKRGGTTFGAQKERWGQHFSTGGAPPTGERDEVVDPQRKKEGGESERSRETNPPENVEKQRWKNLRISRGSKACGALIYVCSAQKGKGVLKNQKTRISGQKKEKRRQNIK